MSEGQYNNAAGYAGRPSVCRHCGALVGSGESNCAMCGTPLSGGSLTGNAVGAMGRPQQEAEAMRFARAIISRPARFTLLFLTANIFVFLLMTFSGGSESHSVLLEYGAKFNSLIDAGEWWRFITPVFIHIGWIHLLANMYGLFMLGPYVEKLYGSAKFVVFWIVTGMAGVLASYLASGTEMHQGFLGGFLFRGGDGPSAGASGALFGLIGVLFVFGIKFRHELPEGFKRAFGTGMLPMILINLFIGYTIPFIDNAAHLGGLVAGAVLALFVGYKRPGESTGIAVFWHILQFAALALVIAGFVMVAFRYDGPRPSLRGASERLTLLPGGDAQSYIEAINEAQRAYLDLRAGRANDMETVVLKLERAPDLNEKAGALKQQLQTLLARARQLAPEPETRAERQRRRQQLNALDQDFSKWQESYIQWARTEGGDFGIVIPETPAETPPSETPSPSQDR